MKPFHFSLKLLLGAITFILILSCNTEKELTAPKLTTPKVINPKTDSIAGTIIFKNGFEGTTRVEARTTQHDNIRGNDGVSKSDWLEDLEKNQYFGSGQIVYEQGDYSQRRAEVIPDPDNANNKVLRLRIFEKHITMPSGEIKARIQYDLQNKNVAPAGGYLKEYYQKVKVYFSPNFSVLENSGTDNIGWIILHEFWNDPSWDAPLAGGGTKPRSEARTEIGIVRKNGKLHYDVVSRCPVQQWPPEWKVEPTFEIPLGKWITEEIYVKEGVTDGRFYLAVTVDNVKTVLVDKIGLTTSKVPGYVPDGQTAWNPIKFYSEGKVLDWFKNQNKTMDLYWDDLEIWFNKRPE